ncbi:unnamed protein product, partial [Discosporangium mesarthrocarpum]
RVVRAWPELLFLRDRHDNGRSYRTLLHAACQEGSLEMVSLLEPFHTHIMETDRNGTTPFHVAASECNYTLLKFLAKRNNQDLIAPPRSSAVTT